MNKGLVFFVVLILCVNRVGAQVNFVSSDLPIVVIDTDGSDIPDEPKVMAQMGIIYNGPGAINNVDDPYNEYDGWIGIELRGSTSQALFDKKSYAVETREEDATNNNVSLLGMPEENDWILYGPYSDKSLVRNVLAYHLASLTMEYAPRTRFCELVIDGSYRGVYVLMEKIKRDKNRVAIDKFEVEDVEGDELTGGYILKLDKETGNQSSGWFSQYPPQDGAWQTTFFQYHYPKPSDIQIAQRNYIQNYIDAFDELMYSDEYADSLTGYRNYIDVNSFVDFMLVNEMCKNVDAYRLSTYLYKDKDSVDPRLKLGPVWDFNLGFGNVDFCAGPAPQGWVFNYNQICPDDFWIIHFWWRKMLRDPAYVDLLKSRWVELRSSVYSDQKVCGYIDSLSMVVEEGATRNFNRWNILNQYVWPNSYIGGSFDEEIAFVKQWMLDRMEWMDFTLENYEIPPIAVGTGTEVLILPNPFRTETIIEFDAPSSSIIELYIYNSLGQLVDVLGTQTPTGPRGRRSITWNSDHMPGIYFYSIEYWGERRHSGVLVKQ